MIRATILAIALLLYPLELPAGERRAESVVDAQVRDIASKLRCPVCQGESVFDSHASLAREMKAIITEKVAAGETEASIISFFEDRYGAYVVMRPGFDRSYAFIWLAPVVIVALAIMLTLLKLRKRNGSGVTASRRVDPDRVMEKLQEAGK